MEWSGVEWSGVEWSRVESSRVIALVIVIVVIIVVIIILVIKFCSGRSRKHPDGDHANIADTGPLHFMYIGGKPQLSYGKSATTGNIGCTAPQLYDGNSATTLSWQHWMYSATTGTPKLEAIARPHCGAALGITA